MTENIYAPKLMRIEEIIAEAPAVRTLRLKFLDGAEAKNFSFQPGQFGLFGVFGEGECPLCIATPPAEKDYMECTFRKMGKVTSALWDKEVGEVIGFRGPYGNWFPIDEMKGQDLVFVAGGIGIFPLRGLIWYSLGERERFGHLDIIYGAQTPEDLAYKRELKEWEVAEDVRLIKTVDPGGPYRPPRRCGETEGWASKRSRPARLSTGWDGKVGLVPEVLKEAALSSENAAVFICGPLLMLRFTVPVLGELGFRDEDIFLSLEAKMKCGVGKCGRCNIGDTFVCKEGPIFSAAQFKSLLPDM